MAEETKKCPFCGEEILKEAKKCKHCGEWLKEKTEKVSIMQLIENYISNNILNSDCINVGVNLTNEKISESKISYNHEEKPLLLLYKKSLLYDLKTRILITDKKIYYKALPDSFWTGITCNFCKKIEGYFELQNVNQLSIADHDHCIGTAYVGHQLKINNTVVGLIRMGTNVEYDENAISYLNDLFEQILKSNNGENIEKERAVDEEKSKTKNIESISDSGWTIVWKLGLAIIGAIICINLFPHAFDDAIVLTNEFTGQKITIPVETTKIEGGEEYCVKLSILEGDEHTFCSTDKNSITQFVTKVITKEMRTQSEMLLKGQDISNETTTFYSLDKMIYEPYKQQYKIIEKNDEKSTVQQTDTNSVIEQKGDIIDTYAEDNNNSENENQEENPANKQVRPQPQSKAKTVAQPVKRAEGATQTNTDIPQTKQNNENADDFMY